VVKNSSEHLLLLIDEVLSVSKAEAGEVILQADLFAPRALIAEVTDLFAAEIKNKGVALSSTIDVDVPQTLIGDKKRLRQILLNVVENALKFSKNSGSRSSRGSRSNRTTYYPHMDSARQWHRYSGGEAWRYL